MATSQLDDNTRRQLYDNFSGYATILTLQLFLQAQYQENPKARNFAIDMIVDSWTRKLKQQCQEEAALMHAGAIKSEDDPEAKHAKYVHCINLASAELKLALGYERPAAPQPPEERGDTPPPPVA